MSDCHVKTWHYKVTALAHITSSRPSAGNEFFFFPISLGSWNNISQLRQVPEKYRQLQLPIESAQP